MGNRFQSVSVVWMVRYIDCSMSSTVDPGLISSSSHLRPKRGWFRFLMVVSSAAQWLRNLVRYTWPAGPRYVLSYGQVPLFGAAERSSNVNSTQISSVLSVIPQFVSMFEIYLYQWSGRAPWCSQRN
jgi:hypothetical protein